MLIEIKYKVEFTKRLKTRLNLLRYSMAGRAEEAFTDYYFIQRVNKEQLKFDIEFYLAANNLDVVVAEFIPGSRERG